MRGQSTFSFLVICLLGPQTSLAAICAEVSLSGPFAPRRLVKCVGGLDVYKSTDPNSCPAGFKIWAPESREDWDTVVRSGVLPVANPHFLVDVTRPQDGCGGCRNSPMNSLEPGQSSWRTSNGQPWWLRSSTFSEPSGDYRANCYLNLYSWSNIDDIRFNDGWCNHHSTDYLCQPIVKEDCTNRTDEITGPCASEDAIFRSSNCSQGVCEQGKYLAFKMDTKINDCQKLCEAGRNYTALPSGIVESLYNFNSGGRFVDDLSSRTPTWVRTVDQINYHRSSTWPGFSLRDRFYMRWEGQLDIKTAGRYKFYTQSDDGSQLLINGQRVVNNGGWHGMRTREGSIDLTVGHHDFMAEFFEGGGSQGMIVHWNGPDSNDQKQVLTGTAFAAGQTYALPGVFNAAGPCMAYSVTADKKCLLYTRCQGVGTGSTCDAALNFLGDNLTQFKTCTLPAVVDPGHGTAFF